MNYFTLRKALIALAAGAVVLILAGVYALQFVPSQEGIANNRGFRILNSIEQNILDKKKNLIKTLDNVYSKSKRYKLERDQTVKLVDQSPFIEGLKLQQWIMDSVWATKYKRKQVIIDYDNQENEWLLWFFGAHYSRKNLVDYDDKALIYSYETSKFFADIIDTRKDFFEDYVILHSDTAILYQTSKVAFAGNFDWIRSNFDSISKPLMSDVVVRDTISGKDYFVFCHPLDKSSDMKLVLCGLVSVERYNQGRFLIDTDKVIWLIFFFMILICTMPFIKVFTLTRYEHFKHTDLLRIGVSLVAGCAFLGLTLFFSASTVAEDAREDHDLKDLSRQIAGNFKKELDEAITELKKHEWNLAAGKYDCWITVNKKNPFYNNAAISPSFNCDTAVHYVKSLIATNAAGIAWGAWIEDGAESPDLDLSARDYTKAFGRSQNVFPNYRKEKEDYYVQPIYSWVDQENTLMVSKRASEAARNHSDRLEDKNVILDLLCIETKFFSLTHTALVNEMEFCIIDKAGNVLFHSKDVRNLRENFLDEVNRPAELIEAIRTDVNVSLKVHYYGQAHNIYATPLAGTPFTLVTMYDKGYFFDSLSNQLTFVLAMLIILTLIYLFVHIVTTQLHPRHTFLKRYKMNVRWITKLGTLTLRSCWWLLGMITFPVLLYYSLAWKHLERLIFTNAFIVPLGVIGLCAAIIFKIYREKYLVSEYRTEIRRKYRIFFVTCGVLCLILTMAQTHFIERVKPIDWVGLVIAIGVTLLMFLFAREPDFLSIHKEGHSDFRKGKLQYKTIDVDQDFFGISEPWSTGKCVILVICLLLLLNYLSTFPALTFFISSMRKERALLQKRNSLELVEKSMSRYNWLNQRFPRFVESRFNSKTPDWSVLQSGIYPPSSSASYVTPHSRPTPAGYFNSPENTSRLDSLYLSIINYPNRMSVDPFSFYDVYETESIHLYRNSDDKIPPSWSWAWVEKDYDHEARLASNDSLATSLTGIAARRDIIEGLRANLDIPMKGSYLLVTLCLSIITFTVIYKVYKRTTLSEYFNSDVSKDKGQADLDFIKNTVVVGSTNLLIVSLPGTNVVEVVKDSLASSFLPSTTLDPDLSTALVHHYVFKAKPGVATDVQSVIMLPFFDLTLADSNTTIQRLEALEKVFDNDNVKVIWITSAVPSDQIAVLSKKITDTEKKLNLAKKEEQSATQLAEELVRLADAHQNFSSVTGNFQQINYSLEDNLGKSATISSNLTSVYIEEEFRFGAYFAKLRKQIVGSGLFDIYFRKEQPGVWLNKFENADEQFVLKIQDMALHYYHSIWSHLNSKEKYVLYDLARDELTNHRNHDVLSDLESKGLIHFHTTENRLKIFNRSFRNFILTVIEPDDAMALEREINLTSKWQSIRVVMFAILITIVVFLFATDQKGMHKLLGLFSTVVALGPSFVDFIANFKKVRLGG